MKLVTIILMTLFWTNISYGEIALKQNKARINNQEETNITKQERELRISQCIGVAQYGFYKSNINKICSLLEENNPRKINWLKSNSIQIQNVLNDIFNVTDFQNVEKKNVVKSFLTQKQNEKLDKKDTEVINEFITNLINHITMFLTVENLNYDEKESFIDTINEIDNNQNNMHLEWIREDEEIVDIIEIDKREDNTQKTLKITPYKSKITVKEIFIEAENLESGISSEKQKNLILHTNSFYKIIQILDNYV